MSYNEASNLNGFKIICEHDLTILWLHFRKSCCIFGKNVTQQSWKLFTRLYNHKLVGWIDY